MKGTITRIFTSDEITHGILELECGFKCVTAELPWRDVDKDGISDLDRSRIPQGSYIAKKRWSMRFLAWLYEVKGVRGRNNILLHRGNYAGDVTKGFKSDVLGCILLGERVAYMTPKGYTKPQLAVINSTATLAAFMAATKGEDLQLLIQNNFPQAGHPA